MHELVDTNGVFRVSVHDTAWTSTTVLFAAGAGGDPGRYATLLQTLAASGLAVVAPHFERLASPFPTETELTLRASRLILALDAFARPGTTVAGIGHSIGATLLVALAGGCMWLGPGQRVVIAMDARLERLGLLAPPTGFFQAPGALDGVRAPIRIWVGSEDGITPPAQAKWLADALRDRGNAQVRIVDGAGHFSFMDQTPPQTTEPLRDKQAFLQEYSTALCKFVADR